jgi:peptidoglycan/xylan/chitin deacetylase (PgdA/CDA1 family)
MILGTSAASYSSDNSQSIISQIAMANIGNDANTITKVAIINFDDGYKSQYTSAKPILDDYGYKASFFITCNFVGKTAKEMNSSSIVNFAGKGVEQMSWQDIMNLYRQGHQVGAHTMNHLRNLTSMPDSELNYEIGQSKQCLIDHGIATGTTTTFAFPYEIGKDNATIVEKIAKYYSYARAGNHPLMFLHCNHYKADPQIDCRTYLQDGKVTVANRYSIIGWSHDYDRIKYSYNDSQMLDRFIQVVNSQDKYNNNLPGQKTAAVAVEAIPIIVYHRIDNSGAPYSTNVSLFAEEMKYLHDNAFKVINLDDLVYDNSTNSFYLKNL